MLFPGPIKCLCSLSIFINILKYFNVTRLPFVYTNKFNQYSVVHLASLNVIVPVAAPLFFVWISILFSFLNILWFLHETMYPPLPRCWVCLDLFDYSASRALSNVQQQSPLVLILLLKSFYSTGLYSDHYFILHHQCLL